MVDAGDLDCGGVAHGELVVAGGETAVVFEVVDAAFDGVSVAVGEGVERWWSSSSGASGSSVAGLVGLDRDGRADAVRAQPGPVGPGGVGLVGQDPNGSTAWWE